VGASLPGDQKFSTPPGDKGAPGAGGAGGRGGQYPQTEGK